MSDEITPDNVVTMDEAKLARAWGIKPGAIRIVELTGEDPGYWKTGRLAVPTGLSRAISAMGLDMPTDWPCTLEPEDPMFEMAVACENLGSALIGLKGVAAKYMDDGRPGAHWCAQLAESNATQLEALMRTLHLAANTIYKRAKAENEIEAGRRLREEGVLP